MGIGIQDQLQRVARAYDLTVKQYREGIDPFECVPEDFLNSKEFRDLMRDTGPGLTASNAPDIREFLQPEEGMKFLDAGCCASLFNYRLDKWPSEYFGIDISGELIKAMRSFSAENGIQVGALEIADLSSIPFDDDYFDIASVIGVLEYSDIDYCSSALTELSRVLKNGARMVVDIPNPQHPHFPVMCRLEEYLDRPVILRSRESFEEILAEFFVTVRSDSSRVMMKYFVVNSRNLS